MTEVDYEAIEAAVTETVRGRWFLNEFSRRNRLAETRLLLDAVARLEATVAAGQMVLPSADPSIRMLVQRIKEIAGHLDGLARDMREDGVDDRHWSAVDHQARAVAGLMRGATPVKPAVPPIETTLELAKLELAKSELAKSEVALLPTAALPSDVPPAFPPVLAAYVDPPPSSLDPRIAALSALDGLTLEKKLALFG